ncbi:MAG: gliding motility protein GldN [Cyclobacteriaceae bacterium]|nr:gliding motility protein GldN [Cyclobacteriaceae bacterium]
MKQLSYVLVLVFLAALGASSPVQAQETANYVNHNSTAGIPDYDIMYKKKLWRRMDLKEKQNRSFFAYNNEITKIIIEAVNAGVLFPYKNDSLLTRMSKEEFLENLKMPAYGGDELTEEEKAMGFSEDDGWGDEGAGWEDEGDSGWGDEESKEDAATEATSTDFFFPSDISVLEIVEDWLFDKRRSRLFYDIQSIKLILPAEKFPETGLQREVATFKYKDLEKLFRSMPEEALWFNPQNSAEHKNLADAFLLRLFSARLIKVANPEDSYISDIYNSSPKDGLIASQRIEQELLELEHELWEY